MGKKLNSNPKAVEARERKETIKKEKADKDNKAKEDALWVVCAFIMQRTNTYSYFFNVCRRLINTFSKKKTERKLKKIKNNKS